MDDFAGFFKWFFGVALGVVGYFVRDLHVQYKEHVKEADARNVRLSVAEANLINSVKRLDEINGKLDELINRGN